MESEEVSVVELLRKDGSVTMIDSDSSEISISND